MFGAIERTWRLLPGSTGHLFILALIHALHGQRAYGAVHFEGACPEGYTSVDGQIPGAQAKENRP
eukprot:2710860-Amphidinium_carterae.1